MSLIFRAVLTMLAALLAAEAQVETDEDRLAKMFSPILILTEETGGKWGDIKVQKPEPVGIMGATSADKIWWCGKSWRMSRLAPSPSRLTAGESPSPR